MRITCFILRTNRTMAYKKIKSNVDAFEFEEGKYFVVSDKVMLDKRFLGYRPILLYKEGIPEPLGLTNILKKPSDDKDKANEEEETVLIDAWSIHNLTSRELLSVLTKTSFTRMEMLIIVFLILNVVLTIISIGVAQG